MGYPNVKCSIEIQLTAKDMSGRCLNTIRAHTHKVNCLQFNENLLVSGSHDTLVKVWDMSGQCMHTFQVRSIILTKNEYHCLYLLLQGHDNMIHCLQFKGNKLITGSSDTTTKLWNINNGERIILIYFSLILYSFMLYFRNITAYILVNFLLFIYSFCIFI